MSDDQAQMRRAAIENGLASSWRGTCHMLRALLPVAVVDLGTLAPQCGPEMSSSQPTVDSDSSRGAVVGSGRPRTP